MEIVSHPLNWKVTRTHQDFENLRDHLTGKYPQSIVPALPKFDYSKRLTEEQLIKRAPYYERFLTIVLKSLTLRSNELLVNFLREKDSIFYEEKAVVAKEEPIPKEVDELSTLIGEVDV